MRPPSLAILRRSVSFQNEDKDDGGLQVILPRTNSDLQQKKNHRRGYSDSSIVLGSDSMLKNSPLTKNSKRIFNSRSGSRSPRRISFEKKATSIILILSCLLWIGLLHQHMNLRKSERELRKKFDWLHAAEIAREIPAWVKRRHVHELNMIATGKHEDALAVKERMVANPQAHFPEGHDATGAWQETLRAETSSAFLVPHGSPRYACDANARNRSVVHWENDHEIYNNKIKEKKRKRYHKNRDTPEEDFMPPAERAFSSLKECGYVYLDSFFDASYIDEIRLAFEKFRARSDSEEFRYPCQGDGRIEYSLPFEKPFNTSISFAHDSRLLEIVTHFLGPQFKLELATVINSTAGSADQRWHQGWRYLFHPEEILPPYALIVTIPLVDVTPTMGPTQVCAGHKLRFYRGYRCNDADVQAAATRRGDVAIFDYKWLHRGPANLDLKQHRPAVSLVYSRSWMVNSEAYVNRGITLRQTTNMRKWWESFYWHPDSQKDQHVV